MPHLPRASHGGHRRARARSGSRLCSSDAWCCAGGSPRSLAAAKRGMHPAWEETKRKACIARKKRPKTEMMIQGGDCFCRRGAQKEYPEDAWRSCLTDDRETGGQKNETQGARRRTVLEGRGTKTDEERRRKKDEEWLRLNSAKLDTGRKRCHPLPWKEAITGIDCNLPSRNTVAMRSSKRGETGGERRERRDQVTCWFVGLLANPFALNKRHPYLTAPVARDLPQSSNEPLTASHDETHLSCPLTATSRSQIITSLGRAQESLAHQLHGLYNLFSFIIRARSHASFSQTLTDSHRRSQSLTVSHSSLEYEPFLSYCYVRFVYMSPCRCVREEVRENVPHPRPCHS